MSTFEYRKSESYKDMRRKYKRFARERLPDWMVRDRLAETINSERKRKGKSRISSKYISQEDIIKYRENLKVIRELKKQNEMNKGVTTKEMTAKEKKAVYMKRYHEKKKLESLQSVAEYENVAAIGVEEPIVEELITKQPEMDIVTEFKKLEQRRIEIMTEVENFNNYVESLKIKLS